MLLYAYAQRKRILKNPNTTIHLLHRPPKKHIVPLQDIAGRLGGCAAACVTAGLESPGDSERLGAVSGTRATPAPGVAQLALVTTRSRQSPESGVEAVSL